jgi:hypothetical protein
MSPKARVGAAFNVFWINEVLPFSAEKRNNEVEE